MKRKVKFLIPVVAGLILVGCKQNVSSSSSSSSKPSSSSISVPVVSSSTKSNTDVGLVDLGVDFSEVERGLPLPNIGENWTTEFTYTYDKAIVLKKKTDFIMTPPFVTTKSLSVKITGFLEKGTTADNKLTVSVQGIDKIGKVITEETINASKITGTIENPTEISFLLANPSGKIGAIKIGLKETGRATNFGITKLQITSK